MLVWHSRLVAGRNCARAHAYVRALLPNQLIDLIPNKDIKLIQFWTMTTWSCTLPAFWTRHVVLTKNLTRQNIMISICKLLYILVS
jgi:hypothetical protein